MKRQNYKQIPWYTIISILVCINFSAINGAQPIFAKNRNRERIQRQQEAERRQINDALYNARHGIRPSPQTRAAVREAATNNPEHALHILAEAFAGTFHNNGTINNPALNEEQMNQLLRTIDINTVNDSGNTILWRIVIFETPELLQIALNHGANPLIANNDGRTIIDRLRERPTQTGENAAMLNILRNHAENNNDEDLRRALDF